MTLATRGFELVGWQRRAVEAWGQGDGVAPCRGTIEVVTGGGKTLIALTCMARVAAVEPAARFAIVVPTQALARQWREVLVDRTSLQRSEIGLLGAGQKEGLFGHRVLIAVLNSAAKSLPELAREVKPLMLIVDECHRAGAPVFSKVLDTPASFRLGLSATPDREEVDEHGEPIAFDEQVVGRKLGKVVFRFGLKEARAEGWLPEYTLHHHAVALTPEEQARYDKLSREVDDAADELQGLGGDQNRARILSRRTDELGSAAKRWVTITGRRKDLLYRASERERVTARLVSDLFAGRATHPRAILFHERVAEAAELRDGLARALPGIRVALEHSKLSESSRRRALADFASGEAPVLVSVKSLIEGIDVPAADTGISVASTASVRQRVQALGRVLRRSVDHEGVAKRSEMHLIYVGDTVDDLIYAKTDWSDLTGADANRYYAWELGSTTPKELPDPPRTPLPTESQAWQLLGEHLDGPVEWPGAFIGQEYSVSTEGVVHNAFRRLIANPQGVGEMVASVREKPGGRFRVTPEHRLVLVWQTGKDARGKPWLVGQLEEPFEVAAEVTADEAPRGEDLELRPGAAYLGPSDRDGGTFRLSQKGGGQIERTVKGGKEFALMTGGSTKTEAAQRVVEEWKRLGLPTSRFYVNSRGHAWYESGGERRFLADVGPGFDWPTDEGERP
ncbi:DEAD/DEAH box helicase [Nocardioides ferulae]|uniref:DEAD/DEAH box helicase n=1 Tax=Nocardioides ferulae TaxID=2340821 RepID=UPI000EB43591|nr:DEAD/DEAH box helicase [Nocardioides ferulae]